MRPLARLALAFALVASFAGGCRRGNQSDGVPVDAGEARRLLVERNWLDVMPESKDDRLHVYRFVPKMGGGVFQDRTLFVGTFELFLFETTEREIRFRFPNTGEKRAAPFRIERIPPEGRDGFDLRLTITGSPRGPGVYYGWSNERRDVEARVLPPL